MYNTISYTSMIKVLVDCFGGDKSPDANIEGSVIALKENPDLELVLVGNRNIINDRLSRLDYDKNRISVIHATEVIECNEQPTLATFRKKDSSLMVAIEELKKDSSYAGMVSLSSTGALLVASVIKLGKIDGVIRPACMPLLPTMNRDFVGVCDSGANVDCSKEELLQFAIMGSTYLETCYEKKSPRVALLNIGVEEIKGDNLHKEAYPLLKECNAINFVGNMESRDLLTGNYDLVVSDGFSGNVLIKSTEGTSIELLKLLKKTFTKNAKNKMSALFLKKDIYGIKEFMDPNNYGGAILLGVNKTIIKGHGSANGKCVSVCIKQVMNLFKNNFIEKVSKSLTENFKK